MVAQRGGNTAQVQETVHIKFFLPEVLAQLLLHCTQQIDICHMLQLGVSILLGESAITMTTNSLFFSKGLL